MLEEKNVKFYMNNNVTEIRGENGKVPESCNSQACFYSNTIITFSITVIQ